MKQQRINISTHTTGRPAQVWRLRANVDKWMRWGPWDEATIATPGSAERGRQTSVERVVVFDLPRRLRDELVSGLPIRNYRAEVTLAAAPDGGTDIMWQSRFEGLAPGEGALARRILGRFIADVAERLAFATSTTSITSVREST